MHHHPRLPSSLPALVLAACALAGVAGVHAESKPAATAGAPFNAPVLSSPMPGTAPTGSGAGYHSPNSPIAPLPQRNDVVPWSVLSDLTKKTTKDGILPDRKSVV